MPVVVRFSPKQPFGNDAVGPLPAEKVALDRERPALSGLRVRRVLRGERVWEAHRTHYYQRLHQLGARHGGTLAASCGLMVGTAATRGVLSACAKTA